MTLFELEALLDLDTSNFETKASNAMQTAEDMRTGLDAIGASDGLSLLDQQLADLDEELERLDDEMKNLLLDLEIDTLGQQNSQIEREISNSEKMTSVFAGVIEGVAEAAADFIDDLIDEAFDYVAEGFEQAANSGSELAERYQTQMLGLSSTVDIIQESIGTGLLALTVDSLNLYETLDSALSQIFNITDQDKLNASLQQISEYEFSNLEQARQSIQGMFSIGENVDLSPVELTFEEALKSYESQQLYWEEYAQILSTLRERGVSNDILTSYAGGTTSDFMMLNWYNSLTDAQLAELDSARAQVEQAESSAAETINELKLATDETYQQMQANAEYYRYRIGLGSNIHLTEGERYAGGGGRRYSDSYGPWLPDGFEADVQNIEKDGEGIETALSGLQTSIDALPGAVAGAISGAQVTVDGQTIGSIILPYISREFRRVTFKRKYTP